MSEASQLILASGSAARRDMLKAAGLVFDVIPANIDEAGVRDAILDATSQAEAADIASVLAAEKARPRFRSACRKPSSSAPIRCWRWAAGSSRRRKTSPKPAIFYRCCAVGRMNLSSAVALARGGVVHWQTIAAAEMTMRKFSDEFLGCYLKKLGDQALQSVGCYELEGLGVQLFDEIDGDYFTILGIPLLPLLARLRREDMATA